MKLHHCAYKVVMESSGLMQRFCESFGAKLIWEGKDQGREIVMMFEEGMCIQFSEVHEKIIHSKNKKETHIAFSSQDPEKDVLIMGDWFNKKGVKTITGRWSDKELWIDCPEVFIDFVIEVFVSD